MAELPRLFDRVEGLFLDLVVEAVDFEVEPDRLADVRDCHDEPDRLDEEVLHCPEARPILSIESPARIAKYFMFCVFCYYNYGKYNNRDVKVKCSLTRNRKKWGFYGVSELGNL